MNWDDVSYYGVMSEEERGLLFAEKDDQRERFCITQQKYLNFISIKKRPMKSLSIYTTTYSEQVFISIQK